MLYSITINENVKKNGSEIRFNFDLNKAGIISADGKTITYKELVDKAFYNDETERVNYFPKRQYYYVKNDTEMEAKVAWLLKVMVERGYTIEWKSLKKSMSAPRKTTK